MSKVAVIILHYKGEDDTKECLGSLFRRTANKRQLQVILVINGASSSFSSDLQKNYPQIETIVTGENLGFAEGNNVGIKKAIEFGSSQIILLNNDTLVAQEMVDELISFVETDKSIGLVSPKIYFASGYEYYQDRYKKEEKGKVIWYAGGQIDWANVYPSHRGVDEVDNGQYDETQETDFATGCCMLIKRNVIDEIGLLDKKYFLYFEDIDYSLRAQKAGFKVFYYPKTHLWHKNASASGKPGSTLHLYYQTRNRLYFGLQYASFWTKKSLILDSIRQLMKEGVYRKAVLDYYTKKMGKGSL